MDLRRVVGSDEELGRKTDICVRGEAGVQESVGTEVQGEATKEDSKGPLTDENTR